MPTRSGRRVISGFRRSLPALAAVAVCVCAVAAAHEEHPAPESMRLIWRRGVGRSIVVPSFMTPAGMVVTTTDSRILLLNPETGRRLWRRGFKAPVEIAPAWAADPAPGVLLVAFAGSRSVLRCLDLRSGGELWSTGLGEPAVQIEAQRGRLWILDRAGRLSCRRTDSGSTIWSRETGSWRGPGFALTENSLILLERTGTLTALDPDAGDVIWSVHLTGRFASPPAIAGGCLAVIDFDGCLLRLDPESGEVLDEERRDPFQSNPILSLGESMVTVSDGGIVERHGGGGPSWRIDLETAVSAGVVHAGQQLLISGVAGSLLAVRPDEGALAWSKELRGGLRVPPLLHGRTMILGTGRGEIHVYTIPR